MRIHLWAASFVLGLGWLVGLPASQFLDLVLAITVVLVAEMINTAVEAVVDLASPEFHPLARVAKDVAAGGVLLAAFGAAGVGVGVFLPQWVRIPIAVMLQFSRHPVPVVALALAWGGLGGFLCWSGARGLKREGG
ncbi:MAG: diacylglycerol kinase family protein [Firmicutes bacterium]|nr:diacylglycerol kinase family protein [Alicyclobacillaceae bacterium]MCL6496933.1 diacylglycerol kinase family protein [Bacillota bacterium]